MKNSEPRYLAFDSLKKCMKGNKYYNLEVLSRLSDSALDERDRSLYTVLVYGVTEKSIMLDYVISRFSRVPSDKLDLDVLVALRLGVYQILCLDRVPDFSACDESVKLVGHKAKAYVNAVLRKVTENKKAVLEVIEKAPLDIRFSMPQGIIDIWIRSYGEEQALEILKGLSTPPPLTLRVNTLKVTSAELSEKIGVAVHEGLGDMLVANGNAQSLYGFDEGLFFVQGTNSRYAVQALGLKPGERVVDTCACPGGKSFSAAIDMKNKGEIYSFDLHENKLSLVQKGAKRLGIDIIFAAVCDARAPAEELVGTADAVICDVPCSGLGIIAKKPDIKYKEVKDIEHLPEVQYSILSASSRYLKDGGRLMYSTCTLNREENEAVVNRFLAQNPSFKRAEGFPKTFFPSQTSDDGFYCDLILKD